MIYYNQDLQKIDSHDFEYLNQGCCAHVAYDHNIILKQYFSNTNSIYRMKVPVFKILKDIQNPHFIELIDMYSKGGLAKATLCKIFWFFFKIDAYTAKYYEKEDINILHLPTDYLLDNFRELENLFFTFSDNAILTEDLHSKNVIFTSQRIILIDPDCFRLYKDNDLRIRNKFRLVSLYRAILDNMLFLEQCTYGECSNFMGRLFDFEVKETTDVTYEISKILKHTKKPIEYIEK